MSPTNSFLTTSDAAGKYQIISQDFDKHKSKAGVSDFSASSQDKIAREMLNASGASFWLKKITHSTYSFSMAINAARVMKSGNTDYQNLIPTTHHKVLRIYLKFLNIIEQNQILEKNDPAHYPQIPIYMET